MYDEMVALLRKKYDKAPMVMEAADAIEELSMRLHSDEAAIAGMKREIERMVKAEKPYWVSVREGLPKNCADVLAYIERNAWGDGDAPYRKREIAIGYHVNGLWHVDWCSGVDCIAWMPLPQAPEPPKEET